MVGNVRDWSALSLVTTFTILHVIAIGIFAKGFLLTRVELPEVSLCALPAEFASKTDSADCWRPAHFKKVVLVIVDALRFDFIVNDGVSGDTIHVERFPNLLDLHEAAGDASVLLRFRADPPTTTMQRVKALMTEMALAYQGGLPTFLDVGRSFSASAISEDNLLHQVKRNGGKLAFVGDDTWEQLCPDLFDIAHPYPSFNVRDLHTVDNGVQKHLLPLAINRTQDWDFLIGHYLGIDHAGHTFGVQTPEMLEKLQHLDEQISEVVVELRKLAGPKGPHNKTLLLVLGDHGQTLNGDHGGGTKEETDSALLAFDLGSMAQGLGSDLGNAAEVCSQIAEMDQLDFAATLALMLGIPIPFGSVGKVAQPLWGVSGSKHELLEALQVNAYQVHNYLSAYSKIAKVNSAQLSQLQEKYKKIEHMGNLADVEDFVGFLEFSAAFAREQWTQFDTVSMVSGLTIFVATLCLQGYLMISVSSPATQTWNFLDWSMLAMCGFHGAALLSNSYVMAEGRIVGFWICSATILLICDCLPSKSTAAPGNSEKLAGSFDDKGAKTKRLRKDKNRQPRCWNPLLCGGLVLCLNVTMEKVGFADRTGANPFDKTAQHSGGVDIDGWVGKSLSHCAIIAIPFMLTCGAPLCRGISTGMFKVLIWLQFCCLSAWWALHDLGLSRDLFVGNIITSSDSEAWGSIEKMPLRLLIPRVVYILSGVNLGGVVRMRRRFKQKSNGIPEFFMSIAGCLLAPVILVSERAGLLVGCMAVMQFRCFFELLLGARVSSQYVAGMMSLFGMQAFFFTGHFCEFSGLHYASGFVGFDEFEFFSSGCLLALNTFGPQILAMLAMPIGMAQLATRTNAKCRRKNYSMASVSCTSRTALVVFITIRSYCAFVCMLSAAVQRRHLLVWAIYAPKFVFEVCFLLVLDLVGILMALLWGKGVVSAQSC